jgi:hypothetical protein
LGQFDLFFDKSPFVNKVSNPLEFQPFKPFKPVDFGIKMADDKVDNGHWGKEKPGAQPLTPFEKVMGPKENLAKYDQKIFGGFKALFVAPAIWWHDHVVQKLRGEEYYWYHRRFRRVPTIDECYFHDSSCR